MPDWLCNFFGTEVAPLIFEKDGRNLTRPPMFCNSRKSTSPASFWLLPPEPAILLASQRFEPSLYHRPRVYFWLPHFLVELRCPYCKSKLEKNGALRPRRVTDISDNFYIVGWAYYCRNGCRKHVTGWNRALIESLPRYLRHSFPAILSHKGGLNSAPVPCEPFSGIWGFWNVRAVLT